MPKIKFSRLNLSQAAPKTGADDPRRPTSTRPRHQNCAACPLHDQFLQVIRRIRSQVALAHQAHRNGNHDLSHRLFGQAQEAAVAALETCLQDILGLLAQKRLPAGMAELYASLPPASQIREIAGWRELFGEMGVDPFTTLSSDALKRLRLGLERSSAAVAPAAEDILRFCQIAGDVIRFLDEKLPEFARQAAIARRQAGPPPGFELLGASRQKALDDISRSHHAAGGIIRSIEADIPQPAIPPAAAPRHLETRSHAQLRVACRQALDDLSRSSRIADKIIRSIENGLPKLAAQLALPGAETPLPKRLRVSCRGTLVAVQGFFTRKAEPIQGVASELDQEGALVTTRQPPAVGSAVIFNFRMPQALNSDYQGLRAAFPARVSQVRTAAEAAGRSPVYEVALKWDRPLSELVDGVTSSYHRKIVALIAPLAIIGVSLRWCSLNSFWYAPLVYLYSISLLAFLASRFLISWLHRSPPLTGYTPSISVIISVRNEQEAITGTVECCFNADYPPEKREVIVVDDGSTDATPRILQGLARRYPGLIVRTIKPSGKRFGMAEGIRLAKGEILVFLDSDTYIYPNALLRIVCGFEDPSLGAVSGYTEVENASKNALTGLQDVRYLVSFRLLKAAESFFGCVTCCPGCLSAYRRTYIMEVLDAWLNQKCFGQLATFGDDRSLTNFILRKYRVIYNDAARAATLVPETWRHYLRQQLRWKKSWVRETFIAMQFMWKKHPAAALSFYGAAVFSLLSPAMAVRVLVLNLRGEGGVILYYLLGLVMMGLISSFYYRYQKASPRMLLGLYWMAVSLAVTGPQTYYALLTVRKGHWGTR